MAENIENLEFQEIAQLPVTENKKGFHTVGYDSGGEAKAYPLDDIATTDEVNKGLGGKADIKDLAQTKEDLNKSINSLSGQVVDKVSQAQLKEVEDKINNAVIQAIPKDAVDTYNVTTGGKTSLLSQYPSPQNGWRVTIKNDERKGGKQSVVQYNAEDKKWIDLEQSAMPDEVLISDDVSQMVQSSKEKVTSEYAINKEFKSISGSNLLTNSEAIFSENWVSGLGNLVPSSELNFTPATSQGVQLPFFFTIGEIYTIKLRAKTSVAGNILHIGSFFSSTIIHPQSEQLAVLKTEFTDFHFVIEANTDKFWIGMPLAKNKGGIVSILDLEVIKKSWVHESIVSSTQKINELSEALSSKNILSDADSTITEEHKWLNGLGDLVPSNELRLTESSNEGIKLLNVLTIGESYNLTLKAYTDGNALHLGSNLSTNIEGKEDEKSITLSSTLTEYIIPIKASRVDLWIGATTSQNKGGIVFIKSIEVKKSLSIIYELDKRIVNLETTVGISKRKTIDDCFNSINRYSKYLTKLCIAGDSLSANEIGGKVPNEEAINEHPMRLLSNNFPRRRYDKLSWNKPTWRRVGHTDWNMSNFTAYNEGGVFEGTQETYYKATQAEAYAEIIIPQGIEHFGLICRQKKGYGKIRVALNGGNVGSYNNPYYLPKVSTNAVVNETIIPKTIARGKSIIDLNVGVSATGNPYHIEQYNNLPNGQPKLCHIGIRKSGVATARHLSR